MVKNRLLLTWILLPCFVFAQNEISIIPRPEHINIQQCYFLLPEEFTVCISGSELQKDAELFVSDLKKITGRKAVIRMAAGNPGGAGQINLNKTSLDERNPDSSGYRLLAGKRSVMIMSPSADGIFYGLQSLLQILATAENNRIPCLDIYDHPAFGWRGMHLDVCRHFFTKQEVKKYLDHLARYKMNTFHWHLTDDQGWRIEIKKYPLLTSKGSWRNGSMIGKYDDQKFDSVRYGGYYTQNDIREIVKYATDRHIRIVPEIEMPGHALAALAAYPQY